MKITLTLYPTLKAIDVDINKDDVKAKANGLSLVTWNGKEILVLESESRIKRMIDGVK